MTIETLPRLKQYALLFDKLHVVESYGPPDSPTFNNDEYRRIKRDVSFLRERELIADARVGERYLIGLALSRPSRMNKVSIRHSHPEIDLAFGDLEGRPIPEVTLDNFDDYLVRVVANAVQISETNNEVVAVCETEFPDLVESSPSSSEAVARIALEMFLTPDEHSAWDDILAFRADAHDKQWGFRRFLHTLATQKQTEAEIRDDIEWSFNEYAKALKLHNLKAGNGFVEVYVIPAIEILEDIVKFKFSKIAKGALSVKKRQIELMDAEMKAPGRECAYVFDARKRFGALKPK